MEHYGNFFETVYKDAGDQYSNVPWARLHPNPELVEWVRLNNPRSGLRAAVVGCGLGDDAEFLQKVGFETVAFDISTEALAAARKRFPDSRVDYRLVNLFELDAEMLEAFDFVYEAYTLQSLPNQSRPAAIDATASLLRPGGEMLLLCLANLENIPNPPGPPHPVRKRELDRLLDFGFEERTCDLYRSDKGEEFRICYRRVS